MSESSRERCGKRSLQPDRQSFHGSSFEWKNRRKEGVKHPSAEGCSTPTRRSEDKLQSKLDIAGVSCRKNHPRGRLICGRIGYPKMGVIKGIEKFGAELD